MEAKLYYTAPSDEVFADIKKAAIEVWGQYKDSPGGYMKGKIDRIENIQNTKDNFMYILAMFDQNNQRKCIALVTSPTKQAIRERLLSGGNDENYIISLGL